LFRGQARSTVIRETRVSRWPFQYRGVFSKQWKTGALVNTRTCGINKEKERMH